MQGCKDGQVNSFQQLQTGMEIRGLSLEVMNESFGNTVLNPAASQLRPDLNGVLSNQTALACTVT